MATPAKVAKLETTPVAAAPPPPAPHPANKIPITFELGDRMIDSALIKNCSFAALTKIDPLAYVITPMRNAVFAHVAIPPDVAAQLNTGVTWNGWRLPGGLALAIVGVVALVLLSIAIVRFSKTE